MKPWLSLITLNFVTSVSCGGNCPAESQKILACFYESGSFYRDNVGFFNISHIDPNLCTHLVYLSAGLDIINNKLISLDPEHDIIKGSYTMFTELKLVNPCLKTLISIGSRNGGSRKYSVMSYTRESREIFTDSVLRFLVEYNFDGLDIDWEYPTENGGIDEDKENFVLLVQELHRKIKVWNFMLTVDLPSSKATIQKGYGLCQLAAYVDYFLLKAYDFKDRTSGVTQLSAPLTPTKNLVDWLLSMIPPNKLVLGIATFASSYTLQNPTENKIGANITGPGNMSMYTLKPGFLSYYELLMEMAGKKYNQHKADETYYAYYNKDWITYDLLDSYSIKAKYAREKKIRGIMVWSIDTDDFRGFYSESKYPVLQTVRQALYS